MPPVSPTRITAVTVPEGARSAPRAGLAFAPVAQDGARSAALPADAAPAPVGWPLVERRRVVGGRRPPARRRAAPPAHGATTPTRVPPTLTTAPLWPFRLAALFGATFRALSDDDFGNPAVVVATATYAVYTAVTCLRPIPYRDDSRVRALIAFEQVLCTVLILTTGAWSSPFALCLVPAGHARRVRRRLAVQLRARRLRRSPRSPSRTSSPRASARRCRTPRCGPRCSAWSRSPAAWPTARRSTAPASSASPRTASACWPRPTRCCSPCNASPRPCRRRSTSTRCSTPPSRASTA